MVKDTLREIKRKWLQFTALIIIIALGVGFFVGIQVTGYDMRQTVDHYTKNHKIMDLEYRNSLGIDTPLLEALQKDTQGSVYGIVDGDVFIDSKVYHLTAFDEHTQGDLTLISGQFPTQAGEAVVDANMLHVKDLKIGDILHIEKGDFFVAQDVKIVGFVNSILYMSRERGQTQLGSGSVEGFLYAEGLKHPQAVYTAARFNIAPTETVAQVQERLIQQQKELSDARYNRVVEPLEKEIQTAQQELDQKRTASMDALDAGLRELEAAQQTLATQATEIRTGLTRLGAQVVDDNFREAYTSAYAAFKEQEAQGLKALADKEAEIEAMPDSEAKEMARAALAQEKQAFLAQMAEVQSVYNQLDAGITAYDSGLKEVNDKTRELNTQRDEAVREFQKVQATLDNSLLKIKEGERGKTFIRERQDVVIGYDSFYQDSERIESIGRVFPLIFFGVAILVTLSSITRMIEESRTQIGIYKALGYSWQQAAIKFIGFTFLAWFLGVILGFLLGFYLIPDLIYNAYRIMYLTPDLELRLVPSYAWLPLLISFVASVGVALLKSMGVSRESAADLMRPPLPKGGQHIFLERVPFIWNRLSFLYKVSIRNLFRNKTRLLMTLVGIGGCCGLLLTGFGLDYSINSIVEKQFENVIHYQGVAVYEGAIKLPETVTRSLFLQSENISVGNTDSVSLYIVNDFSKLSEFIHLQDRSTQQPLTIHDNTVVLTEKLALLNNLKVGDTVGFVEGDRHYQLTVGAITENYVSHYVYMSAQEYETITNLKPVDNMVLFDYTGSKEALSKTLLAQPDVLSVLHLDELRATQKDMMGNFDIVIVVIVVAALALEFVVLLNLITMNMSERQKELATLKVLGFYPHELASYILRENIIMTIISVLLGGVFGFYLHRFVIVSAEIDFVMFNRELRFSSYLWAAGLTLIFSVLINLVMARRANHVNMSEALKTFDD